MEHDRLPEATTAMPGVISKAACILQKAEGSAIHFPKTLRQEDIHQPSTMEGWKNGRDGSGCVDGAEQNRMDYTICRAGVFASGRVF